MMGESGVSMKLLIDTGSNRVLFAEAGKDCVDLLFYILSLPVSTLVRLLDKPRMVGSFPNLYRSLETLNESYIQPNKAKDLLLKPPAPLPGFAVPLLALKDQPANANLKDLYGCNYCHLDSFTDNLMATCRNCGNRMNKKLKYVAPPAGAEQQPGGGGDNSGGLVKGVVTYMVMDDLVVKPMSTISSITLLNQFKIKDLLALEERVVIFGMSEAVKLLKSSLESDKVLTNVFLDLNK